ncbi:MAG TPA: flavin reductase family protein [archaeon]|nr:flavin reductase family protein [archaeon]
MIDLKSKSEGANKFITNVGLITSTGPHGHNIMAAEWTFQISYDPGYIAVCIGHHKATRENISATKEFGVSIAAKGQNSLSSIAGGSSGRKVDKIGALKELGFEFFEANKIKPLLVKGAVLNLECSVEHEMPVGDHAMFIGKVLDGKVWDSEPLAYFAGKYYLLGNRVEKPPQEVLDKMDKIVKAHEK